MKKFFATHKLGLIGGFLFGTVGLFILSMLSLMNSIVETITAPLMWPGRMLASWIVPGNAASTAMVILLVLCTGVLYALIGVILQIIVRAIHRKKDPAV